MRWTMNHAVAWVTCRPRPISWLLIPFLQFPISHMAASHLLRGTGLSSKIVPTLTENCFRQARQVHIRRVLRNDSFLLAHFGHSGPFGHFALATVSRQTIGSEKYLMASIKPLLL